MATQSGQDVNGGCAAVGIFVALIVLAFAGLASC